MSHSSQVVLAPAANTFENFPGLQLMQASIDEDPVAGPYVPVPHAVHSEADFAPFVDK